MKNFISYTLILSFLLPGLPAFGNSQKSGQKDSCENGECVPKIIDDLQDLGEVYRKQCLPQKIKESEIKKYHEEHGLSEECWKIITKINHLDSELQKHRNSLEAKSGCENGNCKQPGQELTGQITDLSKVNQELTCSPEKKQKIKNNCSSDLECVAMASITGIGGYLAEKMLPEKAKIKNCHLGDDSCVTQLATAFFKAAINFFSGAWHLLKLAGNAVGGKVKDLWERVTGPEDHSSTSQLALAKASEDEGFFDELTKDFPGTMKKVWNTFVAATKEWLKAGVFCQKWQGVPHFSKCLQPTESFDCIPCKQMVTGFCSISGTLVAEIVPAFLAGGLLTAAKHGVSGASKISKLFKVSDKSLDAVKQSRLSKMVSKTDDSLRVTKGLQSGGKAISLTLNAINNYLISPARKVLKTSFNAIADLMKSGPSSVAVTPAGKILTFAGTTLKTTFKVVLYPIDNPMTVMAYKTGVRSFEKAITLGKPKLAVQTAVSSSIVTRQPQLESLLAKIDEAKAAAIIDDAKVLKLEKELLGKIEPIRLEAVKAALARDNVDLNDVIRRLYPEIQYGDLAKTLSPEKVLKAERELYLEIASIQDFQRRSALLKKFEVHVGGGEARSRIVGDAKAPHVADPRPLEKTAAIEKYNVPLTKSETEIKQSIREYFDKNFDVMVEKARKTEEKIRNSSEPIIYDSVAIGAGPKNSILVGAMKETNPELSVLVIDSTENLGTFHRVKGFDINSAEWIGDSGNNFPTSPLHVRDVNINKAAWATAEELGYTTQATFDIANPDMLFKTTVTKWSKEPTPGAWPAKYKIETDNGLVVYARSGVVTPGLGTPVNRLRDASSIATVSKFEKQSRAIDLAKDGNYVPRFQGVEEFITTAVKDQKLGREAVARYRKKTTLLVGDGDGGSIGAEAALGFNKQLNPNNLKTDIQLVWMGQGAKTGEEFVKGLSRGKQPRYGRLGEAFDDGRIRPVHGYLQRVEEFTNEAGETQFKAFYSTKSGEAIPEPVIIDNVVFATGYTHSHKTVTPYFESMAKAGNTKGDEISFVPLHGKVNDFTHFDGLKTQGPAEINKQLVVNGQKEDIYLAGLGGKTPISKRKMKAVTGGFLDIGGARSAATGQHIAQSLAPQKLTKTKMVQMLTPAKDETLQFIKRPVRGDLNLPNKELININNKLELGKSLRTFKSQPDSQFFVSVMKNEKGEMIFGVHGLDPKSGEKVVDAISSNTKLVDGLAQELEKNGNRIDMMIPSRSTGAIRQEGIEMRTENVFVKEVIDPKSRWPSALMKIMSPTLRAAGHEKERERD